MSTSVLYKVLATALSLALHPVTNALAQTPVTVPGEVTTLSPEAAKEVLDFIEQAVRENYVDAEKKPTVLATLAEGRRTSRYRVSDPVEFARRLTADLQRSSQDGHMYVSWKPHQVRAIMAGRAQAGPQRPDRSFVAEQTLRENHGLQEMRVLPGNVRYLKIGAWRWDPETSGAAYEAALRFLAAGDAIIIDIRGNGGGTPVGGQYIVSHFVPAETLLMTFTRGANVRRDVALRDLPVGRIDGKPLYVLIDGGAASASEEFALHIDRFKLGELVGENTAGAGHSNSFFGVQPGFELSVSTTLAKHGVDGSNWQGIGVKPHVVAPSEAALEVAHARALQKLARSGAEQRRPEYAWAAEALKLKAQAAQTSSPDLAAYAGVYGDRKVTMKDGALFFQIEDGPVIPLKLLGGGVFTLGSNLINPRVRFENSGGKATAVTVISPDGRATNYQRSI